MPSEPTDDELRRLTTTPYRAHYRAPPMPWRSRLLCAIGSHWPAIELRWINPITAEYVYPCCERHVAVTFDPHVGPTEERIT